jgi:hypothetical protein
MGRYPDIVFHFTKTYGALKKILSSSFKPSYAHETIKGKFENGKPFERDFGVPMVSFCDLRVSELQNHIESYGHFGIGLTKEWAIRNRLHPVFYINEQNYLIPNFLNALQSRMSSVLNSVSSNERMEYRKLFQLQAFLKHYQGRLVLKSGKVVDSYRFADEREWRYVPEFKGIDYDYQFIGKDQMTDPHWKKIGNKRIQDQYWLDYKPSDIKYLIVDEKKAEAVIEFLRTVKGPKFHYAPKIVSLLTSRILTYEQIKNDI